MKVLERSTKLRGAIRALLFAVVTLGVGAVVIWGFVEGRKEAEQEADRERPVKSPQRISLEGEEPVITLDAATV
jgi:hypothetical protein